VVEDQSLNFFRLFNNIEIPDRPKSKKPMGKNDFIIQRYDNPSEDADISLAKYDFMVKSIPK
jgi:hypothetical protein